MGATGLRGQSRYSDHAVDIKGKIPNSEGETKEEEESRGGEQLGKEFVDRE